MDHDRCAVATLARHHPAVLLVFSSCIAPLLACAGGSEGRGAEALLAYNAEGRLRCAARILR